MRYEHLTLPVFVFGERLNHPISQQKIKEDGVLLVRPVTDVHGIGLAHSDVLVDEAPYFRR